MRLNKKRPSEADLLCSLPFLLFWEKQTYDTTFSPWFALRQYKTEAHKKNKLFFNFSTWLKIKSH